MGNMITIYVDHDNHPGMMTIAPCRYHPWASAIIPHASTHAYMPPVKGIKAPRSSLFWIVIPSDVIFTCPQTNSNQPHEGALALRRLRPPFSARYRRASRPIQKAQFLRASLSRRPLLSSTWLLLKLRVLPWQLRSSASWVSMFWQELFLSVLPTSL